MNEFWLKLGHFFLYFVHNFHTDQLILKLFIVLLKLFNKIQSHNTVLCLFINKFQQQTLHSDSVHISFLPNSFLFILRLLTIPMVNEWTSNPKQQKEDIKNLTKIMSFHLLGTVFGSTHKKYCRKNIFVKNLFA